MRIWPPKLLTPPRHPPAGAEFHWVEPNTRPKKMPIVREKKHFLTPNWPWAIFWNQKSPPLKAKKKSYRELSSWKICKTRYGGRGSRAEKGCCWKKVACWLDPPPGGRAREFLKFVWQQKKQMPDGCGSPGHVRQTTTMRRAALNRRGSSLNVGQVELCLMRRERGSAQYTHNYNSNYYHNHNHNCKNTTTQNGENMTNLYV